MKVIESPIQLNNYLLNFKINFTLLKFFCDFL